jgi:tetratricopeptide (TPR) repeat protein
LDQGRLSETDGRFRLASDLGALAVPDSLQSLLGARLDTLDEPARELVGVASVLGISFTLDSLVALAGRPSADVQRVLEGLVVREVLLFDDDPISPERGRYRFVQGVLREVAYGRLSRRDRLGLHLAAAAHFERSGSDELAGIVASHYLSALRSAPEDTDRTSLSVKAGAALEAAAHRSRSIGAHASAAGYLDDAVTLAADEPTRLRLLEARADALAGAGRFEDAEAVARQVVEAGLASGDLSRAARAGTILTSALIGNSRPAVAVAEASAIREALGSVADEDPAAIRLTAELARAHLMSGAHEAALELIERTLPIADRAGLREVVAELLPSRAWAIAAEGRGLEALALLRGALIFAEREGLFTAEMRTRMNLSAWASDESPAEAFDVAWTACRRARERGYMTWAMSAAGNACGAAILLGEWDRVETLALELDVLGEWTRAWSFTMPAAVCVMRALRGHAAEAHELLDRFDRQFPDVTDPQVAQTVLETRAVVAFAEGDLAEATRFSRMVDKLTLELGVPGDMLGAVAVAVEAGDVDRLVEIGDVIGRGFITGRLALVAGDVRAGALRVMRGDADGLRALDAASAIYRADGLRFNVALTQRCRVLLAPDAPGAAAAATEARTLLLDMGALTLLRGLPADPESSPGSRSAAGPDTAEAPARRSA